NDLTDYQVLVELNSTNFNFAHAQTNGEDIRFTDVEGNLLSYWIEEWDAVNETAKVWVKVPSIPANGTVEIWLYYGNGEVTDASDGGATFEFFDDFSGIHTLADYTIVDDGTGYAPSDWELDTINKKIIQHSNIWSSIGDDHFGSAMLTGVNLANFEVRVETKEGDDDIIGLVFCYQDNSHFYHYSYTNDYSGRDAAGDDCTRGSYRWIGKDDDAICVSNLASDNNAPATTDIVEIKIRRYENVIKVFQDGVEILSATDATYGAGDIGLMTDGCAGGEFHPPFIIRKYTEPEPSVSIGGEETP
ncbi:MAG: DUF2341 domain-containing protein, partial [Canidatus Methanoxibalbensis ujae]|nr:DUF2341 domain-containing protein [Candidatus Methanoxibalbensis ujae]